MQPTVVSFFDYTGHAVRPWAEAGHVCYCYDLQHPKADGPRTGWNDKASSERVGRGWIHYIHADLGGDSPDWLAIQRRHDVPGNRPVMVYSFPPCTDLTGSGARHWASKAAINPRFQQDAVAMAKRAEGVALAWGSPYAIENPTGRLNTMWRKPDHVFNPCDYGGWLPEDDEHPRHPKYIAPRDAYTKKTGLWTGNGFKMPPALPVEPEILERTTKSGRVIRGSRQFMKLGGSSLKTKNIRNETPRGWAIATFAANARKINRKEAA